MALAHHDAAHGNQRRGREAPLLCAEQAGDRDVSTSADLTVRLDGDTTSEIVENERLVGLGQSQLPGQARVPEGKA